jgi:hypothetical protein
MMAPFHILHNNHKPNVRDVPSSQPKVQMITKTWVPGIGPTIIKVEVHET